MVEKICVSLHYVKTMRNEERLSPNTLHICESNEIKIYKPFIQKWNMSNDDNEPKNYNNNKKQIVDDIRSGTLLDTWLCVCVRVSVCLLLLLWFRCSRPFSQQLSQYIISLCFTFLFFFLVLVHLLLRFCCHSKRI